MKTYPLLTAVLLAGAVGWAQQPGPNPRGGPPPDLIGENFFPPELVMQNQKAINLTDEQSSTIRAEMQKTMAKFTDLQWQQSATQETLSGLLKAEHVDEKQALVELDKLLAVESEVKKLHFGAMLRIKNLLTTEQQVKLRELRPQSQTRQHQPPHEGQRGGPGDSGQGDQPRPQPSE